MGLGSRGLARYVQPSSKNITPFAQGDPRHAWLKVSKRFVEAKACSTPQRSAHHVLQTSVALLLALEGPSLSATVLLCSSPRE